jgi:glycosyltransferase involved in cell wall biosynthesis
VKPDATEDAQAEEREGRHPPPEGAGVPGLLFIFRYPTPETFGGIPRKVLHIAQWLHERRLFRPVLLTWRRLEFSDAFAALGLPVHYIDMGGLGGLPRAVRAAEALIDTCEVSLVQTHRFWDSIVGRILRRRHPELRHLFRVHTHIQVGRRSRFRKRLYHLLDGRTARYVDRFCALTELVRRELIETSGVPARQVSLVRNGVPPLDGEHTVSDGDEPLPPRFAIVGDVNEIKRQDLAVRAVHALKERGVHVELSLLGRELRGCGASLRRLIEELGVSDRVRFVGFVEDVSGALREIEVVALSSDSEGIPTSIIEAMSGRKLVVVTAVGGVPEFVRHGENGLLVPRGDWRALADTLHEVFTTPARRWVPMREAGYRTWEGEFSLGVMMRGLVEEYVRMGVVPADRARDLFAASDRDPTEPGR